MRTEVSLSNFSKMNEKKRYTTPKLTVYGALAEFTRGTGSVNAPDNFGSQGGTNLQMMTPAT